ncbi:MAG: glycosyltransferase family 4 protein [Brumimicrobium sp.]
MNNQTIAYLCVSKSWGGLEMNQLRNAVWMKERGHEVLLLGLKNSRVLKEAKAVNIKVHNVNQHKKYYDFKRALELRKIIRSYNITHLFLRDPKDISLAVTTKKIMNNKLFLAYFMEMQLGVKKNDFLHTWRFNSLDAWSCPSSFLMKQVEEMTNFPKSKIKVIPSGLDLSKFEKLPTKQEARKTLGLPSDKILLGLIGRFDPFKGHMLLLDAYELLPSDIKAKISLVFLGEKNHPDVDDFNNRLLNRIASDKFKQVVHVLPFRKDVEVFYTAMDATIMASKAETFGMVTIESMASGTLVIGSNAGGTPELLAYGELGILFETMNKESLAYSINQFVNESQYNPKKLNDAVQKFSYEKVCESVEKLLNS